TIDHRIGSRFTLLQLATPVAHVHVWGIPGTYPLTTGGAQSEVTPAMPRRSPPGPIRMSGPPLSPPSAISLDPLGTTVMKLSSTDDGVNCALRYSPSPKAGFADAGSLPLAYTDIPRPYFAIVWVTSIDPTTKSWTSAGPRSPRPRNSRATSR